jgi:hypothetical protein
MNRYPGRRCDRAVVCRDLNVFHCAMVPAGAQRSSHCLPNLW